MRQLALSFFLVAVLSIIAFAWLSFSNKNEKVTSFYVPERKVNTNNSVEFSKLQSKALNARHFIKQNGFDTSFCFLIDMSLPANRKRFFVYNFQKDTISNSGLVAHGNCNRYWLEGRKFGNDIGCGCTSLGKYKIGNSYEGRFGLAFKLYGLDSTNNNAFKRFVVLHSHTCVPENETEDNICQSNGCPTVSPTFLNQLEPIIKNARKPVLLWIFDEEN